MATKRKPGAVRSKASKPTKKSPARPKATAKKAGSSKPKAHPKPAKPAKVAKPAKAAKPVMATKATVAKAKPAKAAAPASKSAKGAPVKGAKGPKLKLAPKAQPVVRPLGVLPPESMARAVHRAPAPAIRIAPSAARPVRESTEGAAPGVTQEDYKEFEQRLLAERAKILKEMGHLENTVLKVNQRDSAGDLSGYSFHMADVGTDAMEREKAFMFASSEGQLLKEINEALRRVYSGEYGVCENCGQPISRARLEAMPYARLCLACKELEERSGRGAS